MVRDIETVKRYCKLSLKEEKLLTSPVSPIVILQLKSSASANLPVSLLSPNTNTLGIMLPYSPLHSLLFDNEIDMLVMTSGNKRGEPVCIKNEEAFLRLNEIADVFLCHNREINLRNDDSLVAIQNRKAQLWRRARGYTPEPIKLNKKIEKTIFAMGAELKNTVTLAFGNEAIISPHIGDLETLEAVNGLEKTVKEFPLFFRREPQIIAVDLHPDMHSTILGKKLAQEKNIPTIAIQHHYAHACSCMAEHNLNEALAVVFDGTGLGLDNTIWGAELLHVKGECLKRLSTFKAVKLLGGDASVLNPVRQLVSRWIDAEIDIQKENIINTMGITQLALLKQQYERNINSPLTHAAGRLFDSVSVILGIAPKVISYEGEAAIRLETEAKKTKVASKNNMFEFSINEINGMLFIDWAQTFKNFSPEFVNKIHKDKDYLKLRQQYALDFHIAVALAISKIVEFGLSKTAVKDIVLSGGVFMNAILTKLVAEKLSEQFKLNIHIHERVPPNDGGISFGQAIAASYAKI
jgi:hydrogenase maturation protein HypF